MNSIVALYFSITSPTAFPFSEYVYRTSYEAFSLLAKAKNVDLRFVLGQQLTANDEFPSYFVFTDGELIKIDKKFKSNLLLLRSRTNRFDHLKRVNDKKLEDICRDKWLTYMTFPDFFKRTVILDPRNPSSIDSLETEKIVLKPRFGSSGKDVRVISKSELDKEFLKSDQFIAQEVIESDEGIKGLIARRHELRLYVFNGKIKASYLRLPARNSYMSNISKGAKEYQFEFSKVPKSAYEVVDEIDKKFVSTFPRIYTVDLMYERHRPYIVELNDMPGTPDISVQPLTNNYFAALLDLIKESS